MMPIASTMPNMVSTLIEKSAAHMTANVPSRAIGATIAGNQGVADLLKEQQHHQEDEYHRLEQGLDDLLDRDLHERRRVEGNRVTHTVRHRGRKLGKTGAHGRGGSHRVGASCQLNTRAGRRLAILADDEVQALGPEFDAGDISQQQLGTIRLGAQDDRREFRGRLQLPLNRERNTDHLAGNGRFGADTARCNLRVLGLDRGHELRQRQRIGDELGGIRPTRASPARN